MTKIGDNHPPVVLELTREEAEFLLANFESNISMALAGLNMQLSRSGQEKLVGLIESFRPLRDKTRAALR